MEKLTRESVRLQKWQLGVTVLIGVFAVVAAYATQAPWVLLAAAITVVMIVAFLASYSEKNESLWMKKVTAVNKLRSMYQLFGKHTSSNAMGVARVFNNHVEIWSSEFSGSSGRLLLAYDSTVLFMGWRSGS